MIDVERELKLATKVIAKTAVRIWDGGHYVAAPWIETAIEYARGKIG